MSATLRADLPTPIPPRILDLPVHRGYPVPWFVAWLDDDGETPLERGQGTPDFRVLAPDATREAHRRRTCWICGGRLGGWTAFVVGPMCAVNRISAEPPSHVDCADWAARACPFLARPHMRRREGNLPSDAVDPAGVAIRRNPGVALVWVTRSYDLAPVSNGILFRMGAPDRVALYAHGREATRDEVEESLETGLPILLEHAEAQGPMAVRALDRYVAEAREILLVG